MGSSLSSADMLLLVNLRKDKGCDVGAGWLSMLSTSEPSSGFLGVGINRRGLTQDSRLALVCLC